MPFRSLSLFLTLILLIFAACKKDEHRVPVANFVTPTLVHPGDTLTIHGSHLGTDPTKVQINLNENTPLPVIKAADSIIRVLLPSADHFDFWGPRGFTVTFDISSAGYSVTFNITMAMPEPTGWFTVSTLPGLSTVFPIEINFPTDSIGYYHSYNGLLKTRDGGETWQSISSPLNYSPNVVGVFDTSHLWYGVGDFRLYTTNDGGRSWQYDPLPAYLVASGGIYMSSPTTGKIVDANGRIYNVSGSFDTTSGMALEHTSPYAQFGTFGGGLDVYFSFSAIDKDNLMAGGGGSEYYGLAAITVKTNGVYDDYTLTATQWPLIKVLLVNNNLGFAIDTKNELLRYTGSRTWGMLPQKATAVYFANATTGYIADDKSIYLTRDGGLSWNPVFTLRPGDSVFTITGLHGKVWAIGNNNSGGAPVGFIYKYNP
jgi:hypothetical protein